MKLLEYEAKRILAEYGIPTPKGGLAANPTEACQIAQNLKLPVVVKAQVPVAGRGKAGGIMFRFNIKSGGSRRKIIRNENKGAACSMFMD